MTGMEGNHVRWNMIQRCTNPKATSYEYYGGRGITICNRWRYGEGGSSGAECFLADMGHRPEGLTLDRRNGDGNYEPSNCYWATWKEQNSNREKRPGLRSFLAPIGVRLPPATKKALESAAKDDSRPVAALAQKIITDWLKANGYLK
jgi:hypothetical protein